MTISVPISVTDHVVVTGIYNYVLRVHSLHYLYLQQAPQLVMGLHLVG